MNINKNALLISNYSNLLTQTLLLSTGGITASVALFSLGRFQHWTLYISVGAFVVSVISGVIGLITIYGEASDDFPKLNNRWVRWPHATAIISFAAGLILFLSSVICGFFNDVEAPNASIIVTLDKSMILDNELGQLIDSLSYEQRADAIRFIKTRKKGEVQSVSPPNAETFTEAATGDSHPQSRPPQEYPPAPQ